MTPGRRGQLCRSHQAGSTQPCFGNSSAPFDECSSWASIAKLALIRPQADSPFLKVSWNPWSGPRRKMKASASDVAARLAELFVVCRLVEAHQREAFAEHQRPLDELAIAGQCINRLGLGHGLEA